MIQHPDHHDPSHTDDEIGNVCFLLEVAGRQIGYYRSRENAEAALAALAAIHELYPPDRITCSDD